MFELFVEVGVSPQVSSFMLSPSLKLSAVCEHCTTHENPCREFQRTKSDLSSINETDRVVRFSAVRAVPVHI